MATRRSRLSSSLRQSLGMPRRVEGAVGGQGAKRKSKLPGMAAGSSRQSVTHRRPPSASQTSEGGPRRFSGKGSSRSSMYGHVQAKKDPRPLSDKAYQSASIKKLISYLSQRNYPKVLTPKALQLPSTKEFLHIFNFLVAIIDETLCVSGVSVVEDVPKTLKILGYPFTVSKNHMLNVGSPHSWPIMLGTLSWLVDCCQVSEVEDGMDILFPQAQGFGDDSEQAKERNEFEITRYLYKIFLECGLESPEYQDAIAYRRMCYEMDYKQLQEDLQKLREENATERKKVEEFSKSLIPALQAESQQNEAMIEQLTATATNLQSAIAQLQADIQQHMDNFSALESVIKEFQTEAQEMEEQIKRQPMTASEARKLHANIQEVEDVLEKNRAIEQANHSRVAELQMQHNRSVSLIDKECESANAKLHQLSALLPEAIDLRLLDYNSSNRANPKVLQALMDNTRALRQELQEMYQKVSSGMSKLDSELIEGETALSSIHSQLVKKTLEIDSVQHTLTLKKEEIESQRREKETNLLKAQAERHRLQKQVATGRLQLAAESASKKELDALRKLQDAEMLTLTKELKDRTEQLDTYFVAFTAYLDASTANEKCCRERVDAIVKKRKEQERKEEGAGEKRGAGVKREGAGEKREGAGEKRGAGVKSGH